MEEQTLVTSQHSRSQRECHFKAFLKMDDAGFEYVIPTMSIRDDPSLSIESQDLS